MTEPPTPTLRQIRSRGSHHVRAGIVHARTHTGTTINHRVSLAIKQIPVGMYANGTHSRMPRTVASGWFALCNVVASANSERRWGRPAIAYASRTELDAAKSNAIYNVRFALRLSMSLGRDSQRHMNKRIHNRFATIKIIKIMPEVLA